MRNVRLLAVFLFPLAMTLVAAPARAQIAEAEPNSTCLSAQAAGTLADSMTILGSLDTPPDTPDVDFYRITGKPGEFVQIDLMGQASGNGTLGDPFVGVFDSQCNSMGYTDGGPHYPDAQMEPQLPADGTLIVAATSSYDGTFTGQGGTAGSYTLKIQRVALALGVSGRIVNGRTGEPVEGAFVNLNRCPDGWCSESVGFRQTGPDGTFRFELGSYGYLDLRAGEYQLYVSAGPRYEPLESPAFQLGEGQDLDLGDVNLTPVPIIGSVRGRLVDALTRDPLPGNALPFSWASLQRCEGDFCFPAVHLQPVDSQGRFVFESSEFFLIPPGRYRIVGMADQYETTVGPIFEIAADQHIEAGDLAVQSYPVRLTLAEGCDAIPAQGGDCQFRVRVTNGRSGHLQVEAWTLVRAVEPGFPLEISQFQLGEPRAVSLKPGASTDLPFTFRAPASLTEGAAICARTYAAQQSNRFDTVGMHDIFCVRKGGEGLVLMPEEEKREVLRRAGGR